MKIRIGILLSFTLFACSLFAQEKVENEKIEKHLATYGKIDFGFSGLSLTFDTPLSEKILLELGAGLGAGYQIDEDYRYRLYFDDPAFFASLHCKYYYKQKRVFDGDKNVSFNSGNFFGIKVKYTSRTLRNDKLWHTVLTGFHWGLQRKLGKHFLYQINLGIGAAFDVDSKTTTHMTLYPDANFRFSYVLPFH